MKYLRLYEDLSKNDWDKYIDESLSKLALDKLIYDIELSSHYDNISDKDMLDFSGTKDKYLYNLISSIKSESALWQKYSYHYSIIFWSKIKSIVLTN